MLNGLKYESGRFVLAKRKKEYERVRKGTKALKDVRLDFSLFRERNGKYGPVRKGLKKYEKAQKALFRVGQTQTSIRKST